MKMEKIKLGFKLKPIFIACVTSKENLSNTFQEPKNVSSGGWNDCGASARLNAAISAVHIVCLRLI